MRPGPPIVAKGRGRAKSAQQHCLDAGCHFSSLSAACRGCIHGLHAGSHVLHGGRLAISFHFRNLCRDKRIQLLIGQRGWQVASYEVGLGVLLLGEFRATGLGIRRG